MEGTDRAQADPARSAEHPGGDLIWSGDEGVEMRKEVVRRQVDYCAFRHMYMKLTHIWTNMLSWQPRGTTGTGRCERRCSAGEWGSKGRWVHRCKIAQGSQQAASGKGRKARKNMMPRDLQQELMQAAVQRARK